MYDEKEMEEREALEILYLPSQGDVMDCIAAGHDPADICPDCGSWPCECLTASQEGNLQDLIDLLERA